VAGRAQQLPPPEDPQSPLATFRADANFVEIDAVVTDERGNPVTSLSKGDFEIYEDGKRQVPSVFALIDLPLPSPAAMARAAAVEPDVQSTRRTFDGRVYVLVLDDLHTTLTRTPVVRSAAKRFIEQYVGPNDLTAVVQASGRLDGTQELTNNRRLLLQAVDRFMGQKIPSAATEKLAIHLLDRSTQGDATDPSASSSQTRDPISDPAEAERAMNARSMFDLITNLAGWMTDLQGRRKAMLLFSEGIDYDIYDMFNNRSAGTLLSRARDAIAAAQRANVSIYAVDPRGLASGGDDILASTSSLGDPQVAEVGPGAFGRELLLSQESLIALADETGGTAAVRSNDIAGALARIARETSTYYLIGYHSDSSRSPGRFRKIEVRVTRPGLKVRARKGYMPLNPKTAPKPREAAAAGGASPALIEALKNPLPVGTLPIRVFAAPFKGDDRKGSVLLAVELSGPDLKFEHTGDTFNDQIEISITAVDYQGKLADSKLQKFTLNLRDDAHAVVSRGGVRLLSRLNLPPSRYQIRVGAHDLVGKGVGTVPYDLEVPDYRKTSFALSGLILTSSRSGGIMTVRPDPLLADVLAAPPTAIRLFGPGDTIVVAGQVYDDSSRLAHTFDVTTTIRSADDDRVAFQKHEERAIPANTKAAAEWYKIEIPLKGVAAGKYVLMVRAASRTGNNAAAVQQVPFEVGN
jgi:VWFA-related protein